MHEVIVGNRVVTPSKIVCVGRNYYAHIEELGSQVPDQMILFSKPNSSISNQLSSHQGEQLHYEGELCFLFENGRFSAVGFGLDLTKRKLQSILKEKGLPWERAKAFDGSAVFSKFIEIFEATTEMTFELKKNGDIVQIGHTELMIHKPQEILSEIFTFMSLDDGDIVMTGTPKGVGTIDKGDVFSSIVKNNEQIIIEETWVAV
ncbi:MAG: fumarylacetoacetate hydrolase family protein [Desulfobacterales bacterium]|jgi:2-keto-4-pentenoate hydratase/2-oxohepta-3-ene-1,7-dioic acid hydratase in catechol pathway